MLIISRKKNEGIVINENTEIRILDIQGDKVRIGIEAPGEVKIVRTELLETEDINRESAKIRFKPDMKKLKKLQELKEMMSKRNQPRKQ